MNIQGTEDEQHWIQNAKGTFTAISPPRICTASNGG